jgi:hypothetical protein
MARVLVPTTPPAAAPRNTKRLRKRRIWYYTHCFKEQGVVARVNIVVLRNVWAACGRRTGRDGAAGATEALREITSRPSRQLE